MEIIKKNFRNIIFSLFLLVLFCTFLVFSPSSAYFFVIGISAILFYIYSPIWAFILYLSVYAALGSETFQYDVSLGFIAINLTSFFVLSQGVMIFIYCYFKRPSRLSLANIWRHFSHLHFFQKLFFCSLFCFYFFQLVSLFPSIALSATFKEVARYSVMIASGFFAYVLAREKEIDISFLKKMIYVILSIPMVYSLYQILTNGLSYRVNATYENPSLWSKIIAICLMILITISFKEREYAFTDLFVQLGIGGMLLSNQTRTTIFGFLCFFYLALILRYYKFLIVLTIIGCILLFSVDFLYERLYLEVVHPTILSSYSWRKDFWQDLLPEIFKRPFFGAGAGTFRILANQVRGPVGYDVSAHNEYLLHGVESGVFSVIAYITMWLSLIAFFISKLIVRSSESQISRRGIFSFASSIGNSPSSSYYLALAAIPIAILVMGYGYVWSTSMVGVTLICFFYGVVFFEEGNKKRDAKSL